MGFVRLRDRKSRVSKVQRDGLLQNFFEGSHWYKGLNVRLIKPCSVVFTGTLLLLSGNVSSSSRSTENEIRKGRENMPYHTRKEVLNGRTSNICRDPYGYNVSVRSFSDKNQGRSLIQVLSLIREFRSIPIKRDELVSWHTAGTIVAASLD